MRLETLAEVFAQLKDHRDPRGRRHPSQACCRWCSSVCWRAFARWQCWTAGPRPTGTSFASRWALIVTSRRLTPPSVGRLPVAHWRNSARHSWSGCGDSCRRNPSRLRSTRRRVARGSTARWRAGATRHRAHSRVEAGDRVMVSPRRKDQRVVRAEKPSGPAARAVPAAEADHGRCDLCHAAAGGSVAR